MQQRPLEGGRVLGSSPQGDVAGATVQCCQQLTWLHTTADRGSEARLNPQAWDWSRKSQASAVRAIVHSVVARTEPVQAQSAPHVTTARTVYCSWSPLTSSPALQNWLYPFISWSNHAFTCARAQGARHQKFGTETQEPWRSSHSGQAGQEK